MIVTKDHKYSKILMPTSAYLSSETPQEATSISLRLNETLLATPTNPHVNRLWKTMAHGRTIYYTTPDYVFHNTGLRKYFRNLLDYQTASGIIEPKDISIYKYGKMYRKFQSLLSTHPGSVPEKQRSALIIILQKLSKTTNVSIKELHIQINADNELVILKKGESGKHYIVVGDDKNDISYLFISNKPGTYTSLHTSNKAHLNHIIDSFSSE